MWKSYFNYLVLASLALAGAAQAENYQHEINGSLKYLYTSGATQSDPENPRSEVNGNGIDLIISYGYFFPNLVQPIMELRYRSNSLKIGNVTEAVSDMEFGLGVLFNVPIPKDFNKKNKEDNKFRNARLIPFGGVMISKLGAEHNRNTEGGQSVSADEMVTQLIFGSRYMIYQNVALSSSIRSFYQSEKTTTTEGDSSSSKARNRLTIEARLLSLSLIF